MNTQQHPQHTNQDDRPLVIVTGSSGLIGSSLVKSLQGDFRVAGLDLQKPDDAALESGWIRCDMTDDQSLESALRQVREEFGEQIASVIHLAAYYDFSGEPSPLYRELTVEGTRRLLRQLRQFDVEQFVFASTLLVMEPSEHDQPLDAESEVDAEWDYPKSKLAAEHVIRQERGDVPAVMLRVAGVYDEDCHSVPIAQQISRIYEKQLESYVFPGDKSCGQAFIHLDDLVGCFRHVIERRGELEGESVFVIGEEHVMSYEQLQEELGKMIHGKRWPTIRIPKVVAKAGAWVKDKLAGEDKEAPFIKPWMIDLADQNYPVDTERARQELGWAPHHTLRDTLPDMIGRMHQNPRQWYEINGLPVPDDLPEGEEQASASNSGAGASST